MFVHAVYFWLKDGLAESDRDEFLRGLDSLATIETVRECHVGVPAATDREVIDRTYSYALVVIFDDERGHDAYQDHPTHDRFRETCAPFWERVRIYDSVGEGGA
jgi:hypothetical protein